MRNNLGFILFLAIAATFAGIDARATTKTKVGATASFGHVAVHEQAATKQ